MTLGAPRLHLRDTGSTNERARRLAIAGAPHGTLVTAAQQSAGRGRQGRTWSAPAGNGPGRFFLGRRRRRLGFRVAAAGDGTIRQIVYCTFPGPMSTEAFRGLPE